MSQRTIGAVVLGFMALRSLGTRGMEEAAASGNIPAVYGHAVAALLFFLAMLIVVFWPERKAR
jgi:hypothetical protein